MTRTTNLRVTNPILYDRATEVGIHIFVDGWFVHGLGVVGVGHTPAMATSTTRPHPLAHWRLPGFEYCTPSVPHWGLNSDVVLHFPIHAAYSGLTVVLLGGLTVLVESGSTPVINSRVSIPWG
uniref:Uncharacterized protein n=1 Tax=Cacopsylla melanoneura TaxID=428564 RepID=A0A8D8WQP4_9HEMI